ncbi:MAG: hypothetical protein JNK65_06240, partial [Deltaproteobacteria bacterium]|nr:hypothetical protein [Deltaproteobacteria bacterium]
MQRLSKIFFTLGFFLFLNGCGGGSSSTSETLQAQSVSTNIGNLNIGATATVTFSNDSKSSIQFSSLQGNEQFILAFHSLSPVSGNFSAMIAGDLNLLPMENKSLVVAEE